MQIIIEDLLGWDMNRGKRKRRGIFGNVLAWGEACEEQGRFTLHSHMLVWIEDFNNIRMKIFSPIEKDRDLARQCLLRYVSLIMSSSYDINWDIPHQRYGSNSAAFCNADLCVVSHQELRDLRHKENCRQGQGRVAGCEACHQTFNTKQIVNNAHQYGVLDGNRPPMSCSNSCRSDILAMFYTYKSHTQNTPSLLRYLSIATKLQFNEHGHRHRPSCFKKTTECRFNIPTCAKEEDKIIYDATETAKWYVVGKRGCPYENIGSFQVLAKRQVQDLYLNTHSRAISQVFWRIAYNCGTMFPIFHEFELL
ncbi:MAG: hypothetical protein ACREOZ_05125, partial [Gloeomargaritales cyanobacterium]